MWTMEQLVERVRTALTAEYPGAPNGRVRDLPDRRSIRWYSTIGLVDRPLGTRGRVALYGPRHLLQLVAIKRRQAAGRTLAEIQAELAGASDEELSAAARVPADLLGTEAPAAASPPRGSFWKLPPPAPDAGTSQGDFVTGAGLPPAEVLDTASHAGGPAEAAHPSGHWHAEMADAAPAPAAATRAIERTTRQAEQIRRPPAGALPQDDNTTGTVPSTGLLLTGVPLGKGVILLVPHQIDENDRGAIAAAARPLLDMLASRGLTDGRDE
jgi:DNA-binding transcriptional MerR regulator